MKKYTIIVLIPTFFMIILIHIMVPEADKTDLDDYISKAFDTHSYRIARNESWHLIKSDFSKIDYHRNYIYANHKSKRRQDLTPYYRSYYRTQDSLSSDLAAYALGYMKLLDDDAAAALEFFLEVKNTKLKYLNNSIGYCYLILKDYDKARYYLQREIELDGWVDGALMNYADILIREKHIPEINRVLAHRELAEKLTWQHKRQFYYLARDFYPYFITIFKFYRPHIIPEGIIGALLITILWFVFIKRMDILEPGKMKYMLVVFILSVVISQFFYPLHDFTAITLQFRLEGSSPYKFFYCVMGIGLIEETIKIIPVLLIFFITRELNEPVDLIMYAAVAALGFAFMENLNYFHKSGLILIAGRAITATMMHMVISAIAVYGLVLYRFKRSSSLWILAFFLTACFLHGIYDFGLLSFVYVQQQFWFFSVSLLILYLLIFNPIIRNTLAISKFSHTINSAKRLRRNGRLLIYNLSYICMVQYAILAIKFGVDLADSTLDFTLISAYIYIGVLSVCLNLTFRSLKMEVYCPK